MSSSKRKCPVVSISGGVEVTKKSKSITATELVQLNHAHAEAALAKEKFDHAVTKSHHDNALQQISKLQSEVNALKIDEQGRLRVEQHTRMLQESLDHKNAKEKYRDDLARDLRDRYSVGDKFAIDPLSGVFLNPES